MVDKNHRKMKPKYQKTTCSTKPQAHANEKPVRWKMSLPIWKKGIKATDWESWKC